MGEKSKERYAMQEIVGKRGEDCTLPTTQAAPFLEDYYFSCHYCQCATVLPHLFVCVFSASSLLIYCNKYLQMWEENSLSSLGLWKTNVAVGKMGNGIGVKAKVVSLPSDSDHFLANCNAHVSK